MALKIKKKTAPHVEKMKEKLANPKSFKNLNLMIDSDLMVEFKRKAVFEGVSMTEIITGMIVEYVDES
jgi:hypothetical protein